MGRGIVYLHYWDDSFIRSAVYGSPKERDIIIKSWHELYRHKINKCYIQIRPTEYSIRLNRDGTNSTGKANYRHELILEEP